MKLRNKCAIITGASQGLGFEIAKQFIQEGAHVILCARDATLLQNAVNALSTFSNSKNKIIAKPTDISKPQEVNALVQKTLAEMGCIDILVSNAGIYGTKGPIDEIDWDEWSEAIDINLKGTVFLSRAVLPHMKKQQHGKMIFISGGGATKPLPFLSAYAVSKAAVVRFAETLAEEVKEFNIDVNSVAPGALNTRLLDEILEAGPEKVGRAFYESSLQQQETGGTPLRVGAKLCVFLASEESDGITGRLISALWDPWKKLPEYIDDIKNSDIYTLRRIIPDDRGKTWGSVK